MHARKRLLAGTLLLAMSISNALLAQTDDEIGPDLTMDSSTSTIVELDGPAESASSAELVEQRFPSGVVQIERWVTETPEGDFVNHGSFTEFNQKGDVVVTGNYENGQRHGEWSKMLSADESKQLLGQLARSFQAPFFSKADFVDGRLSGDWTCSDSSGRLIFVLGFTDGNRNGLSTWFNGSGEVIRSISYRDNLAHGPAKVVLSKEGRPQDIQFEDGKMRSHEEQWYPAEQGRKRSIKSEDWFLVQTPFNLASNDWARSHIEYQPVDKDDKTRHGKSVMYYRNGKRGAEGQYEYGKRLGTFVWWYANGQKKTQGEFNNDLEQGEWTWWHENGMKEARGSFENGEKIATWSVWTAEGKLVKRAAAEEKRIAIRQADAIDR